MNKTFRWIGKVLFNQLDKKFYDPVFVGRGHVCHVHNIISVISLFLTVWENSFRL